MSPAPADDNADVIDVGKSAVPGYAAVPTLDTNAVAIIQPSPRQSAVPLPVQKD